MISFQFDSENTAYGTVIYSLGDNVSIDFKNPITKEFQVKELNINECKLIGKHEPVLKYVKK